ncbi:hypothetical protein B0H16DRAFT_1495155 [Mycena metata]|uniref:DUF1771 domain-containing protein n=1 Tax=Mycena metata TaxID=1033252 RepID=A0AAD7KEJ9_9AGAR|nr:hypothetical protein B0H16DRAFT_1495155 [Mycena metata]
MAKCFAESHEAYGRGDGAGAKQLSNEGHEHQRKMNSLNKEASDWIFILHGLYVKEAIEHTDRALQEAKQRGDTEVHLIRFSELHQLFAELDPHNAGVLVVQMGGNQGGVSPDEIARRLERDDQGCTIM